jgi:hypothetical protein
MCLFGASACECRHVACLEFAYCSSGSTGGKHAIFGIENWARTRTKPYSEHRPATPGVAGSSPVHSANKKSVRLTELQGLFRFWAFIRTAQVALGAPCVDRR